MELDINFLKEIAIKVFEAVNPLLGTKEAAEETERGAGGDLSMKIDLIAENIIIDSLEEAGVKVYR